MASEQCVYAVDFNNGLHIVVSMYFQVDLCIFRVCLSLSLHQNKAEVTIFSERRKERREKKQRERQRGRERETEIKH